MTFKLKVVSLHTSRDALKMVTKPKNLPRDTRGLPEGMDPHKFYEYTIQERSQTATGLEGFLYQIIPWSVIRSFAIAIDPFYQFKVAPGTITPANRIRTRDVLSALDTQRLNVRRRHFFSCRTMSDPNNGFFPGAYTCVAPTNEVAQTVLSPQEKLPSKSSDTTKRTRLVGSDQGEFEKFKHTLAVPGRDVFSSSFIDQYYTVFFPIRDNSGQYWHDTVTTAATLSKAALDDIVSGERSAVQECMADHALAMYKDTNPQFRGLSIFRDIVELKDLPRTVLTLKNTLAHLSELARSLPISESLKRKLFAQTTSVSDIPKEYLSYHFGWKLLYKSILDVLQKPAKISRQIDFLIRRSGKATTYRTSKKFLSARSGSIPSFVYDPSLMRNEGPRPGVPLTASRIEREIELKLVINTTFDFPTLNRPKFAHDLFMDKLGLYPRPTDLYNLVPWTWLVDWFTGLGNYVEVIDEINRDQSLINWGFLTGISTGSLTTEHTSRVFSNRYLWINNALTYSENYRNVGHSSVLHWSFQLRKDLATVMSVKTTANPASLTPYQQSIIGALLSSRTNFRR
jgi:hypothetical protein